MMAFPEIIRRGFWPNEWMNPLMIHNLTALLGSGKDGSWREGCVLRSGWYPPRPQPLSAFLLSVSQLPWCEGLYLPHSPHQDELTLLKTPTKGIAPLCSLLGILSQDKTLTESLFFPRLNFRRRDLRTFSLRLTLGEKQPAFPDSTLKSTI